MDKTPSQLIFVSQAVCEWGRESVESWGKRRRRSLANTTTEEKAEDMTLSQEILVLDFGDEKQSDFLRSDASIDFNEAGKQSGVGSRASRRGRRVHSQQCGHDAYFQTKQ